MKWSVNISFCSCIEKFNKLVTFVLVCWKSSGVKHVVMSFCVMCFSPLFLKVKNKKNRETRKETAYSLSCHTHYFSYLLLWLFAVIFMSRSMTAVTHKPVCSHVINMIQHVCHCDTPMTMFLSFTWLWILIMYFVWLTVTVNVITSNTTDTGIFSDECATAF